MVITECVRCRAPAPPNLYRFDHKVSWRCEKCSAVHLKDELSFKYNNGQPGRYLYISDMTNNLAKIRQHFLENMDMTNPSCAVILVTPVSLKGVHGEFDVVYVDKGSITEPSEFDIIKLKEGGKFVIVDPTSQNILC